VRGIGIKYPARLSLAFVIVLAQNTTAVDQSDCNILIESVIIPKKYCNINRKSE